MLRFFAFNRIFMNLSKVVSKSHADYTRTHASTEMSDFPTYATAKSFQKG